MSVQLPFGKESRVRILRQHFAEASPITPATAWQFIYRKLLWIDGSTGLAHLYESDKAQPGRPWYDRSVAFTELLCKYFGDVTREELRQQLDQLFRSSLKELIEGRDLLSEQDEINETLSTLHGETEFVEGSISTARSETQETRAPAYIPDAELVAEFAAELISRAKLPQAEAEAFARKLVAGARFYYTVERKRQNVLGEGFEDLLQLLMVNVGRVPPDLIKVRRRANTLPGFQHSTARERIEAPDIAIVQNNQTQLLGSVKWSLRHDRQKQLSDELDCYAELLSQDEFPQYVLITNEYDPGRLVNADGLARRGQRVDLIYHINSDLLLNVLDDHNRVKDLKPLITGGRLSSVEDFLNTLRSTYGTVQSDEL